MANPGSFEYECSVCGKMVAYEDVYYLPDDDIVCRDCWEWYQRRQGKSGVRWVNEDDGYPD